MLEMLVNTDTAHPMSDVGLVIIPMIMLITQCYGSPIDPCVADISEGKCLVYGGQDHEVTWEAAEAACVDMGGHLTSIENIVEHRTVINMMLSFELERIWLGAKDISTKYWTWVTNGVVIGPQGCYQDLINARDLPNGTVIQDMDQQDCFDLCTSYNFTFAGLQVRDRFGNITRCYQDLIDARELPNGTVIQDMEQQDCFDLCTSYNFTFAGLQGGHICFCGDDYGLYGVTSGCTTDCAGNRRQNCGGVQKNQIYLIGGSFAIWSNNQPNNAGGYQTCVALHSSNLYKFGDERCEQSFYYICEIDPLDCYGTTGGSYIYANTSWCLFISNELLDWFRARTDCLRRNGDLLTLQDEQKWEAVQPFITENAGDLSRRFWIGLTRRSIEWVTGAQLAFEMWAADYPTRDSDKCIEMTAQNGYRWSDTECAFNSEYFCTIDIPTTAAPTTELPTTVATTPPAPATTLAQSTGARQTTNQINSTPQTSTSSRQSSSTIPRTQQPTPRLTLPDRRSTPDTIVPTHPGTTVDMSTSTVTRPPRPPTAAPTRAPYTKPTPDNSTSNVNGSAYESTSKDSSINVAIIVLIVIVVLLLVCILAGIIIFVVCFRRKDRGINRQVAPGDDDPVNLSTRRSHIYKEVPDIVKQNGISKPASDINGTNKYPWRQKSNKIADESQSDPSLSPRSAHSRRVPSIEVNLSSDDLDIGRAPLTQRMIHLGSRSADVIRPKLIQMKKTVPVILKHLPSRGAISKLNPLKRQTVYKVCPLCEVPCLKRRSHLIRRHHFKPRSKELRDVLKKQDSLLKSPSEDSEV